MKTLHLTLSKKPFEVMVTGEKTEEFRKPTKWIRSRLFRRISGRPINGEAPVFYDVIKFTNGYGKDKPYFICEYKGFAAIPCDMTKIYSNGLKVELETGDYYIILGKIIEKGNLKQ